jgi:hypothetical protein
MCRDVTEGVWELGDESGPDLLDCRRLSQGQCDVEDIFDRLDEAFEFLSSASSIRATTRW